MTQSDSDKLKEGESREAEALRSLDDGLMEMMRIIDRLRRQVEPLLKAPAARRPPRSQRPPQPTSSRVIYGIFDGEGVRGEDGNIYPIPPNYASKSKLVTGDGMRLAIQQDGSYIYKQIKLIAREQVVGVVEHTNDQYWVRVGEERYQILMASVSFYRIEEGDRLSVLLPEGQKSQWATVEHKL